MQYLDSVVDDKSNPGSTDRQSAISASSERLIAEGCWVSARGLADTAADVVAAPNKRFGDLDIAERTEGF